jgi:6-pyruvoyltetrahydropterin/6-carboxytetrahydropterin synthase
MWTACYQTTFSCTLKLREYPPPCGSIHGHHYTLKVWFSCQTLNQHGVSLDYLTLKEWVIPLVAQIDQRFLNDIPPFDQINPTTEHLARWFYQKLTPNFVSLNHLTLTTIELSEDNLFTVRYQPHVPPHERSTKSQ